VSTLHLTVYICIRVDAGRALRVFLQPLTLCAHVVTSWFEARGTTGGWTTALDERLLACVLSFLLCAV
jgi:hypothetical protein